MKVNVRNMQRVPHVHRSAEKNVKINGRHVCDHCPYRWARPKALGTKRPMYDFEKRMLLETALIRQTMPELKRLAANDPTIKGISKMRKADLVKAISKNLVSSDSL